MRTSNVQYPPCPVCRRETCIFGRRFWVQDEATLRKLIAMIAVGGSEQRKQTRPSNVLAYRRKLLQEEGERT